MHRVSVATVSLILGVSLTAAGCRWLHVADFRGDGPPSEEMFAALESQLTHAQWRRNPAWSPLDDAGSAGWLGHCDSVAPDLQSSSPPDLGLRRLSPSHPAGHLRWTFTASPDFDLKKIELLGQERLAAITRQENLVGWNAAILWGRQNPAAADVATVLERLVSHPPTYRPPKPKPAKEPEQTNRRPESDQAERLKELRRLRELKELEELRKSLKPSRLQALWNPRRRSEQAEPHAEEPARRPISTSMQAAAAEAWCLVLTSQSSDPVAALAPARRALQDRPLPADVRIELFRSLAGWMPPAQIPHLADALSDADREKRQFSQTQLARAAIEACLIHALWKQPLREKPPDGAGEDPTAVSFDESDWPETIWNCRRDPDPHVRLTFGQWLSVAKHPRAARILIDSQLLDTDVGVRKAAIISLGRLGTDEAKNELHRQAARPEALVRAAAVESLARLGPGEVAAFTNDRSFQVRRSIAVGLRRFPGVEAALILRELLTDTNPQVQTAVVEAVDSWPDRLALPLLLHGMRDGSPRTRQHCLRNARKRKHIPHAFLIDSPKRQERAQAVAALAREWKLSLNFLDEFRRDGVRTAAKVDQLHLREVRSYLRDVTTNSPQSPVYQAAMERLRRLDPADVPIVERFLLEPSAGDTSVLYRDLLAKLSPAYAALVDMEDSDVFVRRRAVHSLARLAASRSLSPAVVRRLRFRLLNEQDGPVWDSAISAIMDDASDEAAQIALLAINAGQHTEGGHRQSWPDIRIRGLRYIARHGRPEHAVWLLPLLHDPNKSVQLEAIRAAGRCRHPIVLDGIDPKNPHGSANRKGGLQIRPANRTSLTGPSPGGLRSLLTHSDPRVRYAAVVSMSRLNDPQGMQELMRLSVNVDPAIRVAAVRDMGETGQARFVEHLIRRVAWTEKRYEVKRALLKSLDRLVPAGQPEGLLDESSVDAKIKLWQDWWERRQRTMRKKPGFSEKPGF